MTLVHAHATALLGALRLARDEAGLRACMGDFARDCGFDHFQLAPGPHNPSTDPVALLAIGTFPDALRRLYATERACADDPARAQAILRAGSVLWKRAHAGAREAGPRAFVRALRSLGLKDGLTTPVHGPQGCVAILMVAAARPLAFSTEDEEALSHVAMALHQRVKRITAAALFALPEPVALTAREKESLAWVLEGKTNWEIGVLTGVTARTVQFHLGNAARKLGVVNRTQAAVRALVRGDIAPPVGGGETGLSRLERASPASRNRAAPPAPSPARRGPERLESADFTIG